jgi:hypothetical protein
LRISPDLSERILRFRHWKERRSDFRKIHFWTVQNDS